MNELKDQINEELYEKCSEFIKNVREFRLAKTLKRQLNKFNRLCHQTRVATQTTQMATQRIWTAF